VSARKPAGRTPAATAPLPGRRPVVAENPRFFAAPAAWRAWLQAHHASEGVLWVGFHKKDSGTPSITWPESVDEALCFGWIDGVRKSLDATRYAIRFTPRKPSSNWSAVNMRRYAELEKAGRMRAAGRRAHEARREERTAIYTYEQRPRELPPEYAQLVRADRAAWAYFQAATPSYRKAVAWWVVSAKQEETRLRRVRQLVADSAAGRPVPPFVPRLSPHARPKAARRRLR
jgi:uncharacterized protein YdeI (YjbR/CyaY-like superfamily)